MEEIQWHILPLHHIIQNNKQIHSPTNHLYFFRKAFFILFASFKHDTNLLLLFPTSARNLHWHSCWSQLISLCFAVLATSTQSAWISLGYVTSLFLSPVVWLSQRCLTIRPVHLSLLSVCGAEPKSALDSLRVEVSRSHTAGRTPLDQCLIFPASSPPSIAMSFLRLPSSSPYICYHTYEFSAAFHLLELFYRSFIISPISRNLLSASQASFITSLISCCKSTGEMHKNTKTERERGASEQQVVRDEWWDGIADVIHW